MRTGRLIRPWLAVLTGPFRINTLPVNSAMAGRFNRAVLGASRGILELPGQRLADSNGLEQET